jgi:hypothetical protein
MKYRVLVLTINVAIAFTGLLILSHLFNLSMKLKETRENDEFLGA